MDPLSLVAIGAAVGGAAGKFVEKAWDSGEKWIDTFFKDHKEKAQISAKNNSIDFLNELAKKVQLLENANRITLEKLDAAQNHPDFSAILQKALITSSQTESKEKHMILAKLVSERLCSEPESIFSLASKMACDNLSFLTLNQLKLLALLSNLYSIRPSIFPPDNISVDNYQVWMDNWIFNRLVTYKDISIGNLDINHLESLSCLKMNSFISRDLNKLFSINDYIYDFSKHPSILIKEEIPKLWKDKKLEGIDLTTVGQIIGVMSSDQISNNNTSFIGWE